MRVVLGSSSPFRLRLLREHLGPHTAIQVIKPDIDERAITAGAQGDLIFG
jgi:predicted house-cleaning NTP pyrophosphatase (Maf/HAM1 superfamily)